MRAVLLAGAAALSLVATPAAAGLGDWSINPYTTTFSSTTLTVGGTAYGSLFTPDHPSASGFDESWRASGAATLNAGLERDFDSGLVLGLKTAFEVAHDRLSGDNYGSDLVQKVYGLAQTGLGKVEVGMTDGVAYALAVTGPVVDAETTIDNPNATFFRDPVTGHAVSDIFTLNSAVESSLNYAKISYYTPRLFGIQLAASFTPSEGKDVLPFLNNGPRHPNRQKSMWEGAASYSSYFGKLAVGVYAGFIVAHGDGRTVTDKGLLDWGLGTELDYTLSDTMKVAVGGAYRHTNTYAFDINSALADVGTESAHLSATLSDGPWIIGGEYGSGTTGARGSIAPIVGVRGSEVSLGYVFNANLQATVGWQELRYSREAGTFFNGRSRIQMDAAFVHLRLHI